MTQGTIRPDADPPAQPPLARGVLIPLDPVEGIEPDPGAEDFPGDLPPLPVDAASRRRGGGLARLAFGAALAFAGFALAVAAWRFVEGLLAANPILGAMGAGLLALALLLLALLALREALAYARLRELDALRAAAIAARTGGGLPAARRVAGRIGALYAGRVQLGPALALVGRGSAEAVDPDALLDEVEVRLLAPLDQLALAEVERAARRVALVTAFVPLALVDVGTALFANLRLMRRLSEIYGGRSGFLGSLRLLRRLAEAILGAGALALADDLAGSLASGGVLARLSRRFGEGLVNGALTVRLGLAAIEAARPMPFAALPRPGVSATLARALAGVDRAVPGGRDDERV